MSSKITKESLYQHVLNLEEIRHPIDNPEMLEITADYILDEFKEYGLKTSEHKFKIKDFDYTFRNIEGFLGSEKKPSLLLTAHYDTASLSPGANDNASGVAGMLEIARVLSEIDKEVNVRFIGFTLEEENPWYELRIRDLLYDSGLIDDEFRFISYHSIEVLDEIDRLREEFIQKGDSFTDSWDRALENLDLKLTKKEKHYINSLRKLYSNLTRYNWIGESICVGSTKWVQDNKTKLDNSLGVINLEEIGYISETKFSQSFPKGLNPSKYRSYNIDINEKVGNFICIFGDENSQDLAAKFCAQCKTQNLELPFLELVVMKNYNQIAETTMDLLRSDHSPFWRVKVPAISITDTFEFRYPYYHTSSDILDYIDFAFMRKVCLATLGTILSIFD